MSANLILDVKDLEIIYRFAGKELVAVNNVSLQIEHKQSVALIGESGSGKSTIANAVLRILPDNAAITNGTINYKGKDLIQLNKEDIRKIRGREISMVFQDPHTFINPVLKIGDQLKECIRTHQSNLDNTEVDSLAVNLLNLVKIPDPKSILKRYPHQLSGGMAQRVVIAMALSSKPAIVIADELTSALDLTIQAQIVKLLKNLQDTLGLSCLIITHDLSLVANCADRVYVMYSGHIVEEDSVSGLYQKPRHPYSSMLLNAVRQLHGTVMQTPISSNDPVSVDGNLCKFLPRCGQSLPICHKEAPSYFECEGGKRVLCWLGKEV